MAETPSPVLAGVERVVIACDADASLTEAEKQALCEQLVKKAGAVTDLPVASAIASDLDPTELSRQASQLLLKIQASGSTVEQGRKQIALTVTPVRAAVNIAPMPAMKSSVNLVKVQGEWIAQGPVKAFNQLLGSGPRKPRAPFHSDR